MLSLCVSNCLTCSSSSYNSYCTSCADGKYLKDDYCYMCPKFYLKCKYVSPNIVCLEPTAGQTLYFDVFDRCGERCGDSVTEEYDCDNALGIPYDGCNDNCLVMDDFECKVVNRTTFCDYVGNFEFKVVSFKKQKDGNNFTMILKIEPILYSFK